MEPIIKVSELTRYMICPRQVYFNARGHEWDNKGKKGSTVASYILKELAFNLDKITAQDVDDDNEEMEIDAKSIIENIADEIDWIYRVELKEVENTLLEEVKTDIIAELEKTGWLKKVKDENRRLNNACNYEYEREYRVESHKLNLRGSVDKLIRVGDEISPCMVKTGKCPPYGIWKRDRVQLAAYAMLIEEEFETVVKKGFVEYIREGEIRESLIRRSDRAAVLGMLKKVKQIKKGVFPEKGENAPCDNCFFAGVCICESKNTLLSKLLGWQRKDKDQDKDMNGG